MSKALWLTTGIAAALLALPGLAKDDAADPFAAAEQRAEATVAMCFPCRRHLA